jgi:hypothetical protein
MTINDNELRRIWTEEEVPNLSFTIPESHLVNRGARRKQSVHVAGVLTEIRTWPLRNVGETGCRLNHFARFGSRVWPLTHLQSCVQLYRRALLHVTEMAGYGLEGWTSLPDRCISYSLRHRPQSSCAYYLADECKSYFQIKADEA